MFRWDDRLEFNRRIVLGVSILKNNRVYAVFEREQPEIGDKYLKAAEKVFRPRGLKLGRLFSNKLIYS